MFKKQCFRSSKAVSRVYVFIVTLFLLWTYIYYGWINCGFPNYAGEWIHEKYLTRKNSVFEFEKVCIHRVHDSALEHSATLHSYTEHWKYSDDVIEIEHFNQAMVNLGKYTIKRHNTDESKMHFDNIAFLPSLLSKQRHNCNYCNITSLLGIFDEKMTKISMHKYLPW